MSLAEKPATGASKEPGPSWREIVSVDKELCSSFYLHNSLLVEALNVILNSYISEFLLNLEFFLKAYFYWSFISKTKLINPRSVFTHILNQISNSKPNPRSCLWCSDLGIQCCHFCGSGCSCNGGLIPGPGTSAYRHSKNRQTNANSWRDSSLSLYVKLKR